MKRASSLALLLAAGLACASALHAQQKVAGLQPIDTLVPSRFDFHLPAWAPKPLEPAANPTTFAKVELGRHLFYDTRLSDA